jgi:hypothetical protein
VAKQSPAPEPVPDDEVPERIVADPAQQEPGERPWPGPEAATGGIVTGLVTVQSSGCVIGE